MDGLSSLLQQVSFRESWRGYDPDQVDAYVDQVSKAVAWAQREIATLAERVEAAETRSDEISDPQPEIPASGVSQTPEGLARTLALAQSAADEAVAEARQQAEQMVAEAESQAGATIAGATADALQTRSEADEYAESTFANVEKLVREREAAAATAERDKYVSEIAELTAHRALLAEDLELLERHVGEQRQAIERSLSKLTDLVMSPETFRMDSGPASEVAESELGDAVEAETSDAALGDSDDSDGSDADDEERVGESDDLDTDDGVDELDVFEVEHDSDESVDAKPDDEVGLDASAVFDDEIDLLHSDKPLDIEGDDSAASIDSGHGQPRFVTAADLEEQRSVDEPTAPDERMDNGPAMSQLFDEDELPPAVANKREEEPFLAQLREAASRDNVRMDSDDALSAFFNQDEDQRRSPWFLGSR